MYEQVAEYKFNDNAHINLAILVSSTLTTIIIHIPTGTSQPQTTGQKRRLECNNIALDYLSSFGMKAGINYTS